MLTIPDLLTAAKTGAGIPSSYRLARVLGVTDNTVGNWQHGRAFPSDSTAAELARMAGLDPDAVVAAVHALRATSADERVRWERIAHRLQAAAAAVFLSFGLVLAPDAQAGATYERPALQWVGVNLMSTARRALAAVLALLGAPGLPAGAALCGRKNCHA